MDQAPIFILPDRLRSRCIPAAAALYALAALLGLPGVILCFNPDYTEYLIRDLMVSGITNASSLRTWRFVGAGVTALACFGPCMMTAGLFTALRKRPARGANFLANAAQWLLYGVTAAGIGAACLFIYRLIRYIIESASQPNGVMLIYSMLISEALMAVIAGFLFFLTVRFLNCCIDSGISIAYTAATGKLDSRSIPGFAGTGFLLLAIAGIWLSTDRLFTVTAVIGIIESYYKVLFASHPGQWLEAACLLCGSAANFLMFRYLRGYKKTTERALYEARKLKKQIEPRV